MLYPTKKTSARSDIVGPRYEEATDGQTDAPSHFFTLCGKITRASVDQGSGDFTSHTCSVVLDRKFTSHTFYSQAPQSLFPTENSQASMSESSIVIEENRQRVSSQAPRARLSPRAF